MLEEVQGKNYLVTHIVSADGKKEWFVHPDVETEFKNVNYRPYYWLPNEPYVYMTGHMCCIDTPPTHSVNRSLVRLNLETGSLSIVLPWSNPFYSIGFSPNGEYMVWSEGWMNDVHILKLRTGKESLASFQEKYTDIGGNWDEPQTGWSPNGKKVIREIYIYTAQTGVDYCVQYAYAIIDADTGSYQLIDDDFSKSINNCVEQEHKINWIDDSKIELTIHGVHKIYKINNIE